MVPLRPSMLIASASTFVGIRKSSESYLPAVDAIGRAPADADEEAWGLHFLQHVGSRSQLSFRTGKSCWPLPSVTSAEELAAFARAHRVLRDRIPRPGDVFLVWSPAKKIFLRTGIVVTVDMVPATWPDGKLGYDCTTIECVAVREGSRMVRTVAHRERRISSENGDRLIRWTELCGPGESGGSGAEIEFGEAA